MELNVTIFLQILIFLSLLLWLSKFLFSPIMRLFEERERRIDGAQQEAIKFTAEAEQLAKSFDLQYEKAREKARHILSGLRSDMEKEHASELEIAKVQARERLMSAEKTLKEQEHQIRTELLAQSPIIADDIVSALMRGNA